MYVNSYRVRDICTCKYMFIYTSTCVHNMSTTEKIGFSYNKIMCIKNCVPSRRILENHFSIQTHSYNFK